MLECYDVINTLINSINDHKISQFINDAAKKKEKNNNGAINIYLLQSGSLMKFINMLATSESSLEFVSTKALEPNSLLQNGT